MARLAGTSTDEVRPASVEEIRSALADRVGAVVLEVATQEPAAYWRVGRRYFLDDPAFGPVVDIESLDYDPVFGLHRGIGR